MVNVQQALEDAQRIHEQRQANRPCPGCGTRHGGGEHWSLEAAAAALVEAMRETARV